MLICKNSFLTSKDLCIDIGIYLDIIRSNLLSLKLISNNVEENTSGKQRVESVYFLFTTIKDRIQSTAVNIRYKLFEDNVLNFHLLDIPHIDVYPNNRSKVSRHKLCSSNNRLKILNQPQL